MIDNILNIKKSNIIPIDNQNIISSDNSETEINNEISELESIILYSQNKIENDKKQLNNYKLSIIPEHEEYIKKWKAEKKLNMDNINESMLSKYTHRKGFKHEYQMKLMKMIFESVFLEKIEEEFSKREESSKKPNADIVHINKTIFDIYSEIVFEIFKKNCFIAYKFKNILLHYDDWVIDEKFTYIYDTNPAPKNNDNKIIRPILNEYKQTLYDKNLNITNLRNLDLASKAITDLKNEAMKFEGENNFDKVYMPLIDVVQDMIFIKICKIRLDNYRSKLSEVI